MASLFNVIELFKSLGLYKTLFPFILIFALVFGLLEKTKAFGDNKTINAIIALIVGLFFVSFLQAITFISLLIPLVVGLIVLLFLLLLIFMFMGVPSETIGKALTNPAAYGLIIIIIIIFVFVALGGAFPPVSTGAGGGNDVFAKTAEILFSPLVLGTITLLSLFAVAYYFITRKE